MRNRMLFSYIKEESCNCGGLDGIGIIMLNKIGLEVKFFLFFMIFVVFIKLFFRVGIGSWGGLVEVSVVRREGECMIFRWKSVFE